MGVFFAVLTAIVFATNNVIVKKGAGNSRSNNGFYITVLMNAILLGIAFLIALLVRKEPFVVNWSSVPVFIIAGLFTTGLGRMTLYSSILRIGPSRASAIRNSTPLFTVLFAVVILNETITLLPGIGMILLIGGMLMAGYTFMRDQMRGKISIENHELDQKQLWSGYFLALASSFIFGIGQGLRKQGLLLMDDVFFGAWVGAVASLIFITLYQWGRGELATTVRGMKNDFNRHFFIAGTLTSIGPLCFFFAASFMQISYVSAIAASEPLVTTIVSALIIRNTETITRGTWVTVAMIFLGTTMMALFAT